MAKILSLYKISMLTYIRSALTRNKKTNSNKYGILIFIIVIFGITMVSQFFSGLTIASENIKNGGTHINEFMNQFSYTISGVFVFFLLMISSTLLLRQSTAKLVVYPIKSYELLFSLFLEVATYIFIALIFFFIPNFLGQSVSMGIPFIKVIGFIFLFLLTAMFLLSISFFIGIILSRIFLTFFMIKVTVFFAYLTVSLLVGGLILALYLSNSFTNMSSTFFLFQIVNNILFNNSSVSYLYLLIYLVVAIVLTLGFVFLSSLVYGKLLRKIRNGGKSSSKTKNTAITYQRSSILKSIIKKEWRSLFRSPIAFFNIFIGSIITPVLTIIMLIPFRFIEFEGGVYLTDIIKDNIVYLYLFAPLVTTLINMVSTVSSTIISREGRAMYYYKTLPLEKKDLINGKYIFSNLITLIPGLLMVLSIIIIYGLFDPYIIINVIIVYFSSTLFINAFGLFVDSSRPKLEWNQEVEALKNNFNIFIAMLGGVFVSIPLVIFAIVLTSFMSNPLIGLISSISFLVLSAIFVYFSKFVLDKTYRK